MKEYEVKILYTGQKPSHAFLPKEMADEMGLNYLYVPSHITWIKNVNFQKPLEYLSAKSKKKIYKAYEFFQEHYQVSILETLDKQTYLEWLELYNRTINNKEVSAIHLDSEWLENYPQAKRSSAIIIRDSNSKIIGGVILIRSKTGDSFQCAYRAHEYIKIKDSSLSAIIEYLIDDYALKNNYKYIQRGADPNLYGVRLQTGLHDFKVNYGFRPEPLEYKPYFKAALIFFQKYESIITYEYTSEGKISCLNLDADSLEKFTYNFSILNNA